MLSFMFALPPKTSRIRAWAAMCFLALLLLSGIPLPAFADHTECSDDVDNDRDGRIDFPEDDECSADSDDSEDDSASGRDFSISISDGEQYTSPGDRLGYVVTVTNLRSSDREADIRVSMPQFTNYEDSLPDADREGSVLWWRNEPFNERERRTFRFEVEVQDLRKDYLHLQARASADGAEAVDTTVLRAAPQQYSLSIDITDHRSEVERRDIIRYEVTVKNNSSHRAEDLVVTATIPTNTDLVGATRGGKESGRSVRWEINELEGKDNVLLTYSVGVRTNAPLNSVLIATAKVDDKTDRDETKVRSDARDDDRDEDDEGDSEDGDADDDRILLQKFADQETVVAGGSIRYTLSVRNILDRTVRDIVIIDHVDPKYFTHVTTTDLQVQPDGTLEWKIPTLRPGELRTAHYTLRASVNAAVGSRVPNTATLRGENIRPLSHTEYVTITRAAASTGGTKGRRLPSTGMPEGIFALAITSLALSSAFSHARVWRRKRSG